MLHRHTALALAALVSAAQAQNQFILVPDSTADAIVKLSAFDGTVITTTFIVDAGNPSTYDFSTPKDVFQVGNQIWVLDQVSDAVFRFDQNGNWLGTTATTAATLDNCRGGEFVNGVVYVTNDGTGNGAQADSVVTFDTNGNRTGAFSVADSGSSPFDVVGYNGALLVCHFSSVNNIGRYDYAGNPLGFFHTSNGTTDVDLPEQMWVTSNNTVLVAGFGTPLGIFEYNSSGALINTYPHTSALRGVAELGNGLLLITDGQGVKTYDRATGATVLMHATTGGQFFGKFSFAGAPVSYCTAGTSTNGCVPAISSTGTASVAAASGFTIQVANVEGQKSGLIFYGVSGRAAAAWGSGGSSFLCVKAPTQRMTFQSSGGTTGLCDGALSEDWLAWVAAHPAALGQPFAAGNVVDAQAWYRDPPAVKTTNLSDALEFTLVP